MSSEGSGVSTRVWVIVTLLVALIGAGGLIIAERSDLFPGTNRSDLSPGTNRALSNSNVDNKSSGRNFNTYTWSLHIGDFKDISWPEDLRKLDFVTEVRLVFAPKRITYLELVKKASDGSLANLKADIGAKFKIDRTEDDIYIGPGVVRLDYETLLMPVNSDVMAAGPSKDDGRLFYFLKLHVEHINPHSGDVTLRVFVWIGD